MKHWTNAQRDLPRADQYQAPTVLWQTPISEIQQLKAYTVSFGRILPEQRIHDIGMVRPQATRVFEGRYSRLVGLEQALNA